MLHDFIQSCLAYIHHHPHFGEFFAFFIAFLESLPIAGTIVPGTITMTAVGILIGTGTLPATLTLFWTSLGAFIGDTVGYWCGYIFKDTIRNIWPFRKYPKFIDLSEKFFERHGGKSIIIGRFAGVARSTVPMVAGLLQMRWLRFVIAAIPSAISWALVYTIPGILIGAVSVELPPRKMTEFLIIGLIIIVLTWAALWVIQYFFRQIITFINNQVDRLWAWCSRHHGSKSLIRYITNRQEPSCHFQLMRTILVLLFFFLFLISYVLVAQHTSYTSLNIPLFHFAQSLRSNNIDNVMVAFTLLGQPSTILITSFALSLFLFYKRQRRSALYLFGLITTSAAIVYFYKHGFYSPRPNGFNFVKTSSSLPSGHTTMSVVFYGFLMFLTNRIISQERHWINYLLSTLLVTVIAISRLYLGAHWLTDIISGVFLGLSLLLLGILNYQRLPRANSSLALKQKTWIVGASIIFCTSNIIIGSHQFHAILNQTKPLTKMKTIQLRNWWASPTKYLPIYRNNRFGKPIEPFNLEWAAPLGLIQNTLESNGWKVFDTDNRLKNIISRFTSLEPQYQTPFFAALFQNKKPSLIMYKPLKEKNITLEIKLWPTHIQFNEQKTPLWVGNITRHTLSKKQTKIRTHRLNLYDYNISSNEIKKMLATHQGIKLIARDDLVIPKHLIPIKWDKKTILIK